jgi:hypothetical protein
LRHAQFVQAALRLHLQKLPRRKKSGLNLILVITTSTRKLWMDTRGWQSGLFRYLILSDTKAAAIIKREYVQVD